MPLGVEVFIAHYKLSFIHSTLQRNSLPLPEIHFLGSACIKPTCITNHG